MKKIIEVKVKTRTVDICKCKTDMLCVGMFSDGKGLDKLTGQLNAELGGAIEELIELGDFKGKADTTAVLYGRGKIAAKRLMLIGLGEKKKATLDTVRNAAALAAKKAVAAKAETVSIAVHRAFGARFDLSKMGQAIAEGVYFGSYCYDEFVSDNGNGRSDSLVVEVIDADSARIKKMNKAVSVGSVIGCAQNLARTLANRPANVIYPAKLAAEAKKVAANTAGLKCTVFDEKQLKQKKMNGILAVGAGSSNKPRLIVLKYTSSAKSAGKSASVALVGKAVTFDSGGISIKPAAKMDEMKMDMTGGAVVLGAIKAIAELKLAVNVYAIIGAAENKPGSASYRPGDIIETASGKTVEVLNTDAEGRIVLCDAIDYANKLDCGSIIDVATLTGACAVALGEHKAGLMSNDKNLVKGLEKASVESGEPVWQLPQGPEYTEEIKSKIADVKNIGTRYGGACTAGAFLCEFAGETPWAHLDIAGKMTASEPEKKVASGGSTGFGVRLLVRYIMNLKIKS
ncbi:leucyl aminopeptidase [Planctomycetota bacterium]